MRRGDRTAEKMVELNLEVGRDSSSGGKSRTRNLPRSSRSFWRQVEGLFASMCLRPATMSPVQGTGRGEEPSHWESRKAFSL